MSTTYCRDQVESESKKKVHCASLFKVLQPNYHLHFNHTGCTSLWINYDLSELHIVISVHAVKINIYSITFIT